MAVYGIKQFNAELEAKIAGIRDSSARRILTKTKQATPVKTGTLKEGWELEKTDKDTVTVKNDVPYAGYVENGTPKMDGRFMLRTAIQNEILRLKRIYR